MLSVHSAKLINYPRSFDGHRPGNREEGKARRTSGTQFPASFFRVAREIELCLSSTGSTTYTERRWTGFRGRWCKKGKDPREENFHKFQSKWGTEQIIHLKASKHRPLVPTRDSLISPTAAHRCGIDHLLMKVARGMTVTNATKATDNVLQHRKSTQPTPLSRGQLKIPRLVGR